MAEEIIVTGNRDDLVADASRCLLMRFSQSSCRHCFDICPHGAISLDNGLSISPERCRGCLLCTASCPAGALEQQTDFSACLEQLSRVPTPILGCRRTDESAHASLPCLGGLSAEQLLALCHSLPGVLTLNLSRCGNCPNSPMIPHLRQRLEILAGAGLSDSGCRLILAESIQEIRFRDESIDRRKFFKSFRTSLFKSAAVIIAPPHEKTDRRTSYGGKRLPARRALLNKTRSSLSPEVAVRIAKQFDTTVSFTDSCTTCHGCVAICPSGALQSRDADSSPAFAQLLCSGCGLCREFCLDGAVRLATAVSKDGL